MDALWWVLESVITAATVVSEPVPAVVGTAKMDIPVHLDVIKDEDIPQIIAWASKEANPLYPVPRLMTVNELADFYYRVADWSR